MAYKEERVALIVKNQAQTSELAKYIYQFRNIRSTLTKKKLKFRSKLPDSNSTVKIEAKYSQPARDISNLSSVSQQNFVLCSVDGLRWLAEYPNWH